MTMKVTTIETVFRSSLLAGLGLTLLSGCENFFPDQTNGRVNTVIERQATAGAREDATLNPQDFDGLRLNSAGSKKLSRMVPVSHEDSLVVYLNVPSDQRMTPRRTAVTDYLSTCGVEASRVRIEAGGNPNVTALTAPALARMTKLETEPAGETTGASTGGTPAAPAVMTK
jgi:hypothetical protein